MRDGMFMALAAGIGLLLAVSGSRSEREIPDRVPEPEKEPADVRVPEVWWAGMRCKQGEC